MQRKQNAKKASQSSFHRYNKKIRELFLFVLAVISAIQCILFGRQSYILDRFHAQNGFQSLSLRETPLLEGAFFCSNAKKHF